ncbi:MAG: hypothetical protein QXZ63_07615 [Sulfolobales archaeon]
MSKKEYSEPWSPQAIIVDALIDHNNVYVNKFTKRQAKALAEADAVISLISNYVSDVTWLKNLLDDFKKYNKFENGWAVKEASKVARSSATRFMLNLSRWKKLLVGGEE